MTINRIDKDSPAVEKVPRVQETSSLTLCKSCLLNPRKLQIIPHNGSIRASSTAPKSPCICSPRAATAGQAHERCASSPGTLRVIEYAAAHSLWTPWPNHPCNHGCSKPSTVYVCNGISFGPETQERLRQGVNRTGSKGGRSFGLWKQAEAEVPPRCSASSRQSRSSCQTTKRPFPVFLDSPTPQDSCFPPANTLRHPQTALRDPAHLPKPETRYPSATPWAIDMEAYIKDEG